MLDSSILQLLEASKTVPIYTRDSSQEQVALDPGHLNCGLTCEHPSMSTTRSYFTTSLHVTANDGCDHEAGFVWSAQDTPWQGIEPDTMAAYIWRRRANYTSWYVGDDIRTVKLDEPFYVRMTYDGSEVVHGNRHITINELLEDFINDDLDHALSHINIVTNNAVPGLYVEPNVPQDTLRRLLRTGFDQAVMPWVRGTELGALRLPNELRGGVNLQRLSVEEGTPVEDDDDAELVAQYNTRGRVTYREVDPRAEDRARAREAANRRIRQALQGYVPEPPEATVPFEPTEWTTDTTTFTNNYALNTNDA